MELPLPGAHELTLNWLIFFAAGTLVGYELRKAVLDANPLLPLVALDWGVLAGAGAFYLLRYHD